MITFFNAFTNEYALTINFLAHMTIFIGTFYVALQNRKLPHWHVTPLWYAGLCSFLVSITIVLQWSFGPEYPLSYWNAGLMAEALSHISFAVLALIMLISTVRRDLIGRKKRKLVEE